jgi:hypothetical protein
MKPILLASHALTIVAPPVLAVSPVIRGMKPVGGRRGTDVVVTLTGQRLADTKDILFYQPGIRAGAKLLDEHNDEPNVLNTIFGRVIDPQINDTPDPRVVSLAFKAAKRAVQLSGEKNPTHLDTLALAQYLSGHPVAALASEGKAIKALEPGPQPERKAFNERLQRYRKATEEKRKNSGSSGGSAP